MSHLIAVTPKNLPKLISDLSRREGAMVTLEMYGPFFQDEFLGVCLTDEQWNKIVRKVEAEEVEMRYVDG